MLPLTQIDDVFADTISPLRELGAYEALWARERTTFKTIADLVRDTRELELSHFVPEREALEHAALALDLLERAGVSGFGVNVRPAGGYPDKLLEADHPVEVLYYQGNWNLIFAPSVAVVGTRKPTEEGRARARKIARRLVEDGFVVVSGLATGIDTAAHSAAIDAGGNTIGVIGTPLSHTYPRENAALQQTIAREHLLVSQVPIVRFSRQGPEGNRLFFPERNVTMSAITRATVIVEAGETSGTLVQARAALKQGRKLFVLDNCFKNPALSWPAKFEAQGAIRVADYADIRNVLGSPQEADGR